MAVPFGAIFSQAAPFLMQGLNMLGNHYGARQQYKINKRLAAFQHGQNMELLKYQLDYNSPTSQMARFKDAGLNPNLVYGQGSSGNMQSAPQYPNIPAPDVQGIYADLGTKVAQMELMRSQADLTQMKVQESGIKQELMTAQKDLVKANPYLNKDYVNAMVTQLKSSALLKEQEARFMLGEFQKGTGKTIDINVNEIGMAKMEKELQLLYQKFNLNNADQQIKGQVLTSKEFQNELQRIQLNWMKDGEITPQHIYMGIMLLLQKMM